MAIMSNQKVRWGIISTADIGTKKVIPGMQQGEYCDIVAIASRSLDKAKQAANQLGIPKAYGSYEELFADPNIDAVYNPLPNHLHVSVSIQALRAGKHVLCEKPIGLSSNEAKDLVAAADAYPELKVMEAFMYRHHPQWQRTREIVRSGDLGTVRTMNCVFSYYNDDPSDIRNQIASGGGGLMDIGCYPISVSRFLFEAEPRRVFGLVEYDPNFGVDRMASAILDFGDKTATFTCSTQLVPYQQVNILGTKGRVELDIPFNAPTDRPCKLFVSHGGDLTGGSVHEQTVETANQYTVQGDLMSQAILENRPVPTPLSDAVENMRIIEAIIASGRSGGWVEL